MVGEPGTRLLTEPEFLEKHYEDFSHLGGPRTPIRLAVLAELDEEGPLTRRELLDVFVKGEAGWGFDVSKPTLYRQFDEGGGEGAEESLVERGWVSDVSGDEGSESRYALTPKGRLVRKEVSSLFDSLNLLDGAPQDLDPFLDIVARSDVDVEMDREVLRGLADAEIYAATPTDIHTALSAGVEFVDEGDLPRGVSWVSSEFFVDQYHRYLVEGDKRAELVLSPDVLDSLVEGYAEGWGEILETGSIEVFECDVHPFGFTVVDHGVAWGCFEPETGTYEYELISESDAVREWATEVYEAFKQRGRRVTDEQLERTRE